MLTLCLCTTTYLVIIGAISRLVAHLSRESGLPDMLDKRNRHNVPWVVVVGYTLVHLIQFVLIGLNVLDIASVIAIADGFFLANALLGTLAAMRLFTRPFHRGMAGLLSLGILAVLTQSHWQVLVALAALTVFVFYRARRPIQSTP